MNARHLINTENGEYGFFRKIRNTNGYEVVVDDQRIGEFYKEGNSKWVIAGEQGASHRTTHMAAASVYARFTVERRSAAPVRCEHGLLPSDGCFACLGIDTFDWVTPEMMRVVERERRTGDVGSDRY